MPTILLVDDDIGALDLFERVLLAHGFQVVVAKSGTEACFLSRQTLYDVILSDLQLPDFSGVELLRRIRSAHVQTPMIIVTGFGTVPSAIEAIRLGVSDYLVKPLSEEDLLYALTRALATGVVPSKDVGRPHETLYSPAAGRWATLVVQAVLAPTDPRTLDSWSQQAHVARATLESRCHAAGVAAKTTLDFARLLRAVILVQSCRCNIEDLLDADPRTVERLLGTAGLTIAYKKQITLTTDEFLDTQRFIPDGLALQALRHALIKASLRTTTPMSSARLEAALPIPTGGI